MYTMSIKVLRFGNAIAVEAPMLAPGQQITKMVDVVWAEIGQRTGANRQISESSAVLDMLLKEELQQAGLKTTGLDNFRIHTQPVREEVARLLVLGKEYPGFINRHLHSLPVLVQQQNALPRMIDGRPTFFTTSIGQFAKEDEDLRMPNETLAVLRPEWFNGEIPIVSQTARTEVTHIASSEEMAAENNTALARHPLSLESFTE